MIDPEIRILLIEDNALDAELLTRHLKKSNLCFKIEILDQLDLVDEFIVKNEIDVIICDYKLSGFTGTDVIKRVHSLNPELPIILISGLIPDEQAIEAVIAGAKDYVLKDNFTRLIPAINREFRSLQEKRKNKRNDLFLNSLFESQIGVIVTDKEHTIQRVNSAYCELLGYTNDEFMVLPIFEIFPENIRSEINNTYNQFIKNGNSSAYETKNITKDGKVITVIASSKRVETYDGVFVISTVIDITQRKENEKKIIQQNTELTRLKKTREKLYSIIGHDLKNALFGISGLLAIILEDAKLNPNSIHIERTITKLSLLHNSSENATRLLENLLDWVQAQSGNLVLDKTEYNVSDQTATIIHLLSAQASHKKIEFKVSLADNLIINADHRMIGTVIRNLISNAIKFTNSDGKIEIETFRNDTEVLLKITDNGIGIPSDIASSIFDPDNRPHRSGTIREKGTGLGMILVKELIDLHNGSICFNSEEGVGTEFLVSLPM